MPLDIHFGNVILALSQMLSKALEIFLDSGVVCSVVAHEKFVVYLGYQIGENTTKPLHSNTEAIDQLLLPIDLKSLRGFLEKVH